MKLITAFFPAAVGALSCEAVAQDRTIIPLPEPAFEGTIGKTYKESTAAWPKEILQEVVDGSFSGGGFLGFDSVDELNSGDHFGQ